MITLKDALSLSENELKEIKQDINKKAKLDIYVARKNNK